jgi:hypothetical protein
LGDESLFEVFNDFILSPERIDFAADSLLSDEELSALQPDSIVLATLSFTALAPGVSPLDFDPSNPPGILIVSHLAEAIDPSLITVLPGEIVVLERVQTPEPSTLWLGLAGLLAVRKLRRRRAL